MKHPPRHPSAKSRARRSVNHPSRIHNPENKRPRAARPQYDCLYHVGRGRVERYDPERHGSWEIYANESGKLAIRHIDGDRPPPEVDSPEPEALEFDL
jgi:hypothetical protein